MWILPLYLLINQKSDYDDYDDDDDITSAFHMQGNILLVSGVPAILPSQLILPSGDVNAVNSVVVVRIWYNKTIVALVQR